MASIVSVRTVIKAQAAAIVALNDKGTTWASLATDQFCCRLSRWSTE